MMYPKSPYLSKTLLTVLAGVLFSGYSLELAAQQNNPEVILPPLQLQRFRPAPGPADYLNVFGTSVLSHLDWTVSAYADYSDDPMQIRTHYAPYSRTVDYQVSSMLLASLGIANAIELGVMIPFTIAQASEELLPVLPAGSARSRDLQSYALGDWRLTSKFQIVDLSEAVMGIALVTGVTLPLGSSNAFASDEGVGVEGLLAADFPLFEVVRLGINVGYRHRPGQRVLRENVIGNEILWGIAGHTPSFVLERLDFIGEVTGSVGIAKKRESIQGITPGEVPVEAMLAMRYKIAEKLTFTGGAGLGLSEGIGAPNKRVFVGLGGYWVVGTLWRQYWGGSRDWKPNAGCEFEVSDPEWPRDSMGCPVPEGELRRQREERADRWLDAPVIFDDTVEDETEEQEAEEVVAEPIVEEVADEEPPPRVEVTRKQIVIREQIFFATDKAEILSQSYSLLDEVARVLHANPQIAELLIEGHTDSQGSAAYNLGLSQRRAESVMRYLIGQGINADRLRAQGFGLTRPIDSNEIAEGRARNRRVEFTIVSDDEDELEADDSVESNE